MRCGISNGNRPTILAGLLVCMFPAAVQAAQETELDVISLSVTVTDTNGRPVLDLEPDDFVILQQGTPIEIERFEGPALPLNVAIVADPSPRPGLNEGWTRDALKNFVRGLRISDAVTVIEARAEIRQLVRLTTDRGELNRAINEFENPGNPTNRIFDTTTDALVTLLQAGTARGAVVVITDGIDVGSDRDQESMVRAIRIAGMPVYVVAVDNAAGYSGNLGSTVSRLPATNRLRAQINNLAEEMERRYYTQRESWRALADGSGGAFFGLEGDDFSDPAGQVTNRLRAIYTFYYLSDGSNASGWTPIDVRVNRPGVEIRAPAGVQLPERDPTN